MDDPLHVAIAIEPRAAVAWPKRASKAIRLW